MNILTKFHGVIPPVSTIIDANECLDEKGMKNLIDFLIESKVNGLFFLGSGGEFSQMSTSLRKKVAEFAVEYVNGRLPVLIGTGTPSTKETISLSMHAKEIGADGIVVINPYYWPLSEDNLFQHFAQIAEKVDIPTLLYNFPALTGQDLSPEFVLKLVESYPNIVGIKETVDAVAHTREMILTVKAAHPDFAVFSGYDDHFLNTLSLGGDGSIPGTANFAPELSTSIYQSFMEKNYAHAIETHRLLSSLLSLYQIDKPFVSVIKEALSLRGVEISTNMIAPARRLNEEKKEQVKKILNQVLDIEGIFYK
ncbi:dihydrodipicolinate synthase family protein (plasmid) [Priestia megaterium NCT-2]|uniref:dihydrodipicolinate synthase family protein n=1 Tax=Priestia megaterium TaxID=1404 RepID=UPI000EB699E5|nr:dihydrodipicolinate synthase family protein [Priestia megaterium]AYE53689.1 dihydrodipicolinate synthase family protein [Priestia megaterium NCT-2]